MKFWFSLTIFLFILMTIQANEFLFYGDKKLLSKCIEDYLTNNVDSYYRELGISKFIAVLTTSRVHGTVKTKGNLKKTVENLFNYFKREKYRLFRNNQIHKPLEWALREALTECADGSRSILIQAAPSFKNEPIELANVLDYILVDWPIYLRYMIRTKYGRALLRRFAADAKVAFDSALNYVLNRNHFRVAIREIWMRRAWIFFDNRQTKIPYIQHRYSMGRGLYVKGDIHNMSLIRSAQSFSNRNPRVPRSIVTEFLKIHEADRPPYVEKDIFIRFEENDVTSAEYYIDTRIDQFYQILLYVRELQVINISTDEEDIYENSIPFQILNSKFHQMFSEYKVHQNILLDGRMCMEWVSRKFRTQINNETALKVFLNTLLREECLITAWIYSIKNYSEFFIHCFDNISKKNASHSKNKLYDQPIVRSVLVFPNEPPTIANVLDYVLINWPYSLYHMIGTKDGRAILRKYATEAQGFLEFALNSIENHNQFRYMLRFWWTLRAEHFFDGHSSENSYFNHRYTLEYPFPHTIGNQDLFYDRRVQNFSLRNPLVQLSKTDNIFNIPSLYRPYCTADDIFSAPGRSGIMSSYQYYIETHIDLFYRTLFFLMELKIHGISSDEEDIYNGPIPDSVVPFQLQEIVYNTQAYHHYLRSLQTIFVNTFLDDEEFQIMVAQVFSKAQIFEEDLITLLKLWFINTVNSNTTARTATSSTTTTSTTIETTLKYEQYKRKGSVWVNSKGKHFCNRPDTKHRDGGLQSTQIHDQTYGYVLNNFDSSKMEVLTEESFTDWYFFSKTIN